MKQLPKGWKKRADLTEPVMINRGLQVIIWALDSYYHLIFIQTGPDFGMFLQKGGINRWNDDVHKFGDKITRVGRWEIVSKRG